MLAFFSFCSIFVWKKKSIAFILGLLVILTSVFAALINRTPILNSSSSILIQVYVAVIMFIGIHWFRGYHSLLSLEVSISKVEFYNRLMRFVLITGIAALIINAFIVFKSFNLILASTITVEEYKNQGGASNYLTRWVNPLFLTFSHFISPLGYIALATHFFFLVKKQIGKSLLFLLVSLNLPLHGLHALSRSDSVQYIMLYVLLLVLVFPLVEKRIRRNIFISVMIVLGGLIFLLSVITNTRFEDKEMTGSQSYVQNSSVYSVLEYGGQWHENGMITLENHDGSNSMYGASTLKILNFYGEQVGFETKGYIDVRKESLGRYSSKFNGLPSTLVYDFGYFFAFIAICFYALLVKINSPKNGFMTLGQLINVSVLLPIITMFFGNNALSSFSLGMGVVYMITLNLFKHIRI